MNASTTDRYNGVPLGVEALTGPLAVQPTKGPGAALIVRFLVLALSLALGACGGNRPVVDGVVESVREIDLGVMHDLAKQYEHPLVPEVAWQVTVRAEDGSEITVIEPERRYQPGERVRLLNGKEGPLLL